MALMGKDVFYMFLCSEDSKSVYPQNVPQDFMVQLPERVQLFGEWTVALLEVEYPTRFSHKKPTHLWFEMDLCDTSIVGEHRLPVLRRLPIDASKTNKVKHLTFDTLFYMPIRQYDFNSIHILITDHTRAPASFAEGVFYCALQFVRKV